MKGFFAVLCAAAAALFSCALGACVSALSVPVFASEAPLKIVIDAGHGGVDGGVAGSVTGEKESDVNLQIALLLVQPLKDAGLEVTLTRKTSGGLYGAPTSGFKKRDMQARKEIVQACAPALVLSVHQNFYPSKTPRGGQAFFLAGDEQGRAFAECLQRNLNDFYARQGAKGRAVAEGDFFMLKCTSSPSVLVECGFLSNAKDERILTAKSGQQQLAQSLVAGILEYLSLCSGA